MPSLRGARDERAVVDALAVVEPGVLMRVELHQRQRPVDRGMRLEQRPGDEMVAAERQQERAGFEQFRRLALDRARRLLVVAVVEQAIAIVDHGELFEQVAVERILRIVVEDRGGAADRLRAEARARPVGHGGVEGNAPDDRVRALHVLGIFAPHEGERPGIGRVAGAAERAARGEGVVDRACRHVGTPSRFEGTLIRHSFAKCDPFLQCSEAAGAFTPLSCSRANASPTIRTRERFSCEKPSLERICRARGDADACAPRRRRPHRRDPRAAGKRQSLARPCDGRGASRRRHGRRQEKPSGEFDRRASGSAIELGVEMVELDMQKSSDGEFVVFHEFMARPQLDLQGRARAAHAGRTEGMPAGDRGHRRGDRRSVSRRCARCWRSPGTGFSSTSTTSSTSRRCRRSSRWRATWAWPTRSSSSAISGTPRRSPR